MFIQPNWIGMLLFLYIINVFVKMFSCFGFIRVHLDLRIGGSSIALSKDFSLLACLEFCVDFQSLGL